MTHATRGRVSVEVQGQTYTLALTTNALCALEDALSTPDRPVSFQDVLQAAQKGRIREIRAVVWAALHGGGHTQMSLADAGDWIERAGGFGVLGGSLGQIAQGAAPDPEDTRDLDSGARARPPQAQVNGTGVASKSRRGASA